VLTIPDYLKGVNPVDPMKFALPNEHEIGALVKGSHSTSGDFALTLPELVKKLEMQRGSKQGLREKVLDVVERHCRKEPDSSGKEWLVWKH
jgi:3-hydroxyisobutyryl-CoA hydrolase